MKKSSFSPVFYSLGVTAILFPLLFSGCSVLPRETRYDDSTIKYNSDVNPTAKYHQGQDPRTNKYTVGQYDDATAYYTTKQKGSSFPESEVIKAQPANQGNMEVVEERVMVLEVSDVLFDFDKAVIKAPFVPELDKWVDYFKANPEASANIYGHADSTGPEPYNMTLSEKRAQAVVKYLVDHGVEPARLTAKGFGENQPAADNKTKEGRQKNRRVEMTY